MPTRDAPPEPDPGDDTLAPSEVAARPGGAAIHHPREASGATTQFDARRPTSRGMEPTAVPDVGYEIDHFRVVRPLGQGGMGRVLLARDQELGRLVALKLIREDRVEGNSIEALTAEARLTARLSHPNIVTIHHIGRWENAIYLALEYVEGGTLRERLATQRPTAREAMRMALPIARALEAAHAARVTHCDLKPENVLVPPDGRLRVVDFGIARAIDNRSWDERQENKVRVAGTPGYMAPEQWLGEPPTEAVDLWALGVMLFEMIAGHRPFEGPHGDGRPMHARVLDPETAPRALTEVGDGLRELVARLLNRNKAMRPTAAVTAKALERLLGRDDDAAENTESPFRGLLPFEERHAPFFFGRESEVDAAVERLRAATVLAVVGPSGAGKSSFVQAGVVPRLREQQPLTLLALRPGAHPLTALAAQLLALDTAESRRLATAADGTVEGLADRLLQRPSHANLWLHGLADATQTRVVLLVDQLEEVVTQGCPPAHAQAFLDAVALAADAVDDQVRVIFTLRDDFLARVALGDAMTAVLQNVLVVRRLEDEHLRDAATRPLLRLGYAWDDPEVVSQMVAELRGLASALPLLQFACAALWERRDIRTQTLRRTDYAAIGGVAGALAAHAEAVFDGLTAAELGVARHLLLRLVAADGARRVVARSQALEGLGAAAPALVERFAAARLLTVRRSRLAGDEAVLELAHDALLKNWPQLRKWLDESSEERLAAAEVEEAARLWQARGRPPREVWPLDGVHDARRRLRQEAEALSPTAREFLADGEALGQRERRRRRTLLGVALGLALAVTVTSVVVALAFAAKEQEARRQSRLIARAAAERAEAAADTGLVDLQVQLVDWSPERTAAVPVDAARFPHLQVSLWEVDVADAPTPERPRDPQFVRWSQPRVVDGTWRAQLQTRSGPVFLRVSGRGEGGTACGPAFLPIRSLPGWSQRQHGPSPLRLLVPSCAATAADLTVVPAGPFFFAGPGEPAIPGHVQPDPETRLELAAFAIDRTEVANGRFAAFAANQAATGIAMPEYPHTALMADIARPDHPVVAVDAFTAAAFCAWMGKRLPSSAEWSKAGRGGLTLDAAGREPNPEPRRNLPWGGSDVSGRMNLRDTDDPWPATAPVDALPRGASPYGVLGLADNVSEWTRSDAEGGNHVLRTVRGADWALERGDGMHSLAVENARSPKYFQFGLGFRCALEPDGASVRSAAP